jgi:hypothetical protein
MSLYPRDENGVLHVVALSGGKDSTDLAFLLKEREPRPYVYVCTPTGDELPEMFEHWRWLGSDNVLGSRILPVVAGTLAGEIAGYGSLPSRRQRWCTRKLKIEPYRRWLTARSAEGPIVSYVGLRADEEGRAGGAYNDIPGITMRFPLREWGMTEADVLSDLEQRDIRIPERTDCARCFWQTLGEWWVLWREHLATFLDAEADEERTGDTWRTPRLNADGTPVMVTRWGHTFAACWRDTWPVRLSDMRLLFEAGRIPPRTKLQSDAFRGTGGCRACSL